MLFSQPVVEGGPNNQCLGALRIFQPVRGALRTLTSDENRKAPLGVSFDFMVVQNVDVGAGAGVADAGLSDHQLKGQLSIAAALPGNAINPVVRDQRAVIIVIRVFQACLAGPVDVSRESRVIMRGERTGFNRSDGVLEQAFIGISDRQIVVKERAGLIERQCLPLCLQIAVKRRV